MKKSPFVSARHAEIPGDFYKSITKFNPNFLKMEASDMERYTVYDRRKDYLFMIGKSLESTGMNTPTLLGVVSYQSELNNELLQEFSTSAGVRLFPAAKNVEEALDRILSELFVEVKKEGGMRSLKAIAAFHHSRKYN